MFAAHRINGEQTPKRKYIMAGIWVALAHFPEMSAAKGDSGGYEWNIVPKFR